MLVSVVIPTFGHAGFVTAAVKSALSQEVGGPAVEVIVVNDGSTDETADVLRPLVEGGKIRYVEQANAGQAVARNRGIELSRGEFVALLDDDDQWPADKLAWQMKALRQNPRATMAWGDAVRLDDNRPLYPPPPDAAEWQGERVIHKCLVRSPGQALIRRSTLERVGGFDPNLWGTDDFDLYIRLAEVGPFVYQPRTALLYRWHAGNASNQTARMLENEQKVRRKHVAAVERRVCSRADRSTEARERRYQDRMWLGWYHFLDGRYGAARRNYLAAARIAPGRFLKRRSWKAAFVPDPLRPLWREFKARRRPTAAPSGRVVDAA